jgi:AcrR family transcriptional regulator
MSQSPHRGYSTTRHLKGSMAPSHNDPLSACPAAPVRDEQAEKRAWIIERAVVMFNELGFARVRIGDITESLNMGKGTFYLYFKNKRDLLLACFEHIAEQILVLESLPKIREGDFFSRIGPRMETVHAYEWWPGLINLLREAELSPDAEIKEKARQAYDTIAGPLRRDLEEAARAGGARDVDSELAAYGFIGLAENLWFRSRLDSRYTKEQTIALMVDAMTHWLAVTPDDRGSDGATRLVTRDGAVFDLTGVRWDGRDRLSGSLGLATVEIDLARISRLHVGATGERCAVELTTTDGTEVELQMTASALISGQAPLGTVLVALKDLNSLVRMEPCRTG